MNPRGASQHVTSPLEKHHGRAALILACCCLVSLLTLAHYRSPLSRVWGDEGTYLAMMESLARDGDLQFDRRDLARTQAAEGGRTHLILQRHGDAVSYSKPVLYAIVAAPFYALFGTQGPILLNALALGFALALAYAYLRRLGNSGTAALVLVTFVGGAVLVPYVAWRMTDLFQAALALAGLTLCFTQTCFARTGLARTCLAKTRDAAGELSDRKHQLGWIDRWICWRYAPIFGIVLLAATASLRPTNGVLVAAPILAAIFERRLKDVAALTGTAIAGFLIFSGLTVAVTGAPNPYRAVRSSFTPTTGYPAGDDSTAALSRFDTLPSSESTGLKTHADFRRSTYSTFYFFAGRHTGLLVYFPAAVIFLLFALRRSDAIGRANLLALAAALIFFIGWRTNNYFGGDTFIGNRYFPSIYPLLLFALPRLPGTRWLAAAWVLAGLAYGSAMVSVTRFHELDASSQSHTRAGIFRLLPYESTSIDIVGRRDRYWAGHFVRFVDPFLEVGQWHAELYAGRPPAELLVAHWRPLDKLRLFIETSAPEAVLEFRDYGRTVTFPVGTEVADVIRGPLGVQVDLKTSRPWRLHQYWWDAHTQYLTHSLRLRLLLPQGGPATAVVRYFGDPQLLDQSFAYERLAHGIPDRVTAGITSQAAITLRNTSSLTWEAQDVVPVRARYQLFDGDGSLINESGRIELPQRVEPYDTVVLPFDVTWPTEPGPYLLKVDLVLEHVAWFEERVGSPVLATVVDVTSPE